MNHKNLKNHQFQNFNCICSKCIYDLHVVFFRNLWFMIGVVYAACSLDQGPLDPVGPGRSTMVGIRAVRPVRNFLNFNARTVRSRVRSFQSAEPQQSNSEYLLLGVPWTLYKKFILSSHDSTWWVISMIDNSLVINWVILITSKTWYLVGIALLATVATACSRILILMLWRVVAHIATVSNKHL